MKRITLIQAGALFVLAIFGAYAGAQQAPDCTQSTAITQEACSL